MAIVGAPSRNRYHFIVYVCECVVRVMYVRDFLETACPPSAPAATDPTARHLQVHRSQRHARRPRTEQTPGRQTAWMQPLPWPSIKVMVRKGCVGIVFYNYTPRAARVAPQSALRMRAHIIHKTYDHYGIVLYYSYESTL